VGAGAGGARLGSWQPTSAKDPTREVIPAADVSFFRGREENGGTGMGIEPSPPERRAVRVRVRGGAFEACVREEPSITRQIVTIRFSLDT